MSRRKRNGRVAKKPVTPVTLEWTDHVALPEQVMRVQVTDGVALPEQVMRVQVTDGVALPEQVMRVQVTERTYAAPVCIEESK